MSTLAAHALSTGLISRLQDHGLFQNLSPSASEALTAGLEEVSLSGGEWLFRQGEPGDSMFLLDSGSLRVVISTESGEQTEVDQLGPGAPVGEMSLLTGQARTADVQCVTGATLIRLSKACFDELIQAHPEIGERIARLVEPRFQRSQLAGVLCRFFGQLEAPNLHEIQSRLEWRRVASGELVYRQGDSGNFMVIVVNGRLRVVADHGQPDQRIIGEVGRGESVGEYSLLTGEPREASVCAVRDSDLLILPADTCQELIQRFPQALLKITRNLALRLQRVGGPPDPETQGHLSLAVVPITQCASLSDFAHNLRAEIGRFGPTLLLSADGFDSRFGKEGAAQVGAEDPVSIAIVGWLNEQESRYRHIIYQADCEWSEWTRRCLRQSDRIVFVAEAGPPLEPTPLEQAIAELNLEAQKDLVLLYRDPDARPKHTAAWLAPRKIDTHHHLRLGQDADCGRVARSLTDRALGLVLSGGAARGAAHFGVHQALNELGIAIDMIGGTSMGSLLGALFALEYDQETLLALGREHMSGRALMDYTFPAVALCQTKKIGQLMEKLYGSIAIEDLFIPYFCVSSNLSKSVPVVHRTGSLALAVRASIAIPGIFTPVSYNGDLLVDGGVMNNLPVDVMREQRGIGTVIAVLVSPEDEAIRSWEFESDISGWKVLARRFNPLASPLPVPSVAETIMRTLEVNSAYLTRQNRRRADLFIEPDTSAFGSLDWKSYPEVVEVGYKEATRALTKWQAENPELAGNLW